MHNFSTEQFIQCQVDLNEWDSLQSVPLECQIKVEGTHLILEFVFIGHCLQYGQMIISCGVAAKTKVVCQDVICAASKPHKQPSISPSIQSRLDTPGSLTEKLRTVKSRL